MRKGEAILMPMKGTPKYISVPKPAIVASVAERTPIMPTDNLFLTQSHINTLNTLKLTMRATVNPKYGVIAWAFLSSSSSRERETKRVT